MPVLPSHRLQRRDPGRHVLQRQGKRPAGSPEPPLRVAAHHLTQLLICLLGPSISCYRELESFLCEVLMTLQPLGLLYISVCIVILLLWLCNEFKFVALVFCIFLSAFTDFRGGTCCTPSVPR
jgi:hypothetical protein